MKELDLTILMPCLNEEANISISITKAKRFLNDHNINGEILIVDNGSNDSSKEIARSLNVRVVEEGKQGYGMALMKGIKEANSKYIIMGDSDGTYDFYEIKEFYDRLNEGYDLVVGNRFINKMENGAMSFINKYIGNPILSFIGNKLFPCNINDFHCGLRGFNKEKILKLKLCSSGMEFASEMIIKAVKNKYKMIEVPITLYKSPNARNNHLRPFKDGIRHLKVIFKNKS